MHQQDKITAAGHQPPCYPPGRVLPHDIDLTLPTFEFHNHIVEVVGGQPRAFVSLQFHGPDRVHPLLQPTVRIERYRGAQFLMTSDDVLNSVLKCSSATCSGKTHRSQRTRAAGWWPWNCSDTEACPEVNGADAYFGIGLCMLVLTILRCSPPVSLRALATPARRGSRRTAAREAPDSGHSHSGPITALSLSPVCVTGPDIHHGGVAEGRRDNQT